MFVSETWTHGILWLSYKFVGHRHALVTVVSLLFGFDLAW